MKITKKLISLVVTVSMILSCFPIISYANLVGAEKAKIELVPMKLEDGISVTKAAYDNFSETTVNDLDLQTGDTFYVGIKMVDFDNITEMANGMASIGVAFEFDTDYLSLITQQNTTNTLSTRTTKFLTQTYTEEDDYEDSEYILGYTIDGDQGFITYEIGDTSLDSYGEGTNNAIYFNIEFQGAGLKPEIAGSYTGDYDGYLAIVGFTLNSEPPAGTDLFSFITDKSNWSGLSTGSTTDDNVHAYQLENTGMTDSDILTVLDYDVTAVDFFPASTTYTSLTAIGTLATQYDERALNTTGLTFTATPDAGDDVTVSANDITFYYADADTITDATSESLTALGDTISSSTHNGKYLYAVYGGCIALVGQMTVTTDTISGVSAVDGLSSAFTGDTNYTGTTVASVLGDTALVDVTWTSGTTTSNVKYADLATNGLGLFTVDGSGNLTAVAVDATIAAGDVTYCIAPTGSTSTSGLDGKYATFTITGTTASITALSISGSIDSVTYGNSFDWSNVSVTATSAAGTNTYTGWDEITGAGIELDYTDGSYNAEFLSSSVILVPGTVYVYAKVGEVTSSQITATVNQREIETTEKYTSTPETKVYDATTDAKHPSASAEPSITNKVNDNDVSIDATYKFEDKNVGENKNVTISYELSGEQAAYYKLPTLGTEYFPTSGTGTITALEVTLPSSYNVPAITKGATELSGTSSVQLTSSNSNIPEAETDTITLEYTYTYANSSDDTPTVTITDLVLKSSNETMNYTLPSYSDLTDTGSTASISKIETTDKLVTSGITYGDTYASLADDATDTVITLTYSNNDTKSLTMAEAIAAGYVKLGDDTVTSADTVIPVDGGSLVFTDGTVSSSAVTLSVSPKTITLDISGVTASDTITKTYDSTTALPSGITLSGLAVSSDTALVGDDTLTESAVTGITYVYSSKNVGAAVAIKASGTPTTSDETFNKKYTLALPTDASTTVTGAITAKEITVNTIEVDSIAAGAEDLTGSGTLLLSTENSGIYDGDTVSLKYAYKYSTSDPDAETVTVEITSAELSGDDAGNYTLSATPAATGSVSAKQLTSIDDFELNAVYNSDGTVDISNAVISVTYADGGTETYETLADAISAGYTVTVTDDKGDEVTLTDGAFAVTAGTTYTVTVSKDGVSIDANDGTTTAETKTETATVKVPVTPAEPTLTVSQSTNAITASAPVDTNGDDIDVSAVEYLVVKEGEDIPADAEWTTFTDASAITFTEDANGDALEQGGKYTVYVRVAATEDSIASSEVSADVTTYAHKVEILRTNSTTVIATAYVDDVTVSSYSDFASATGIKVSSSYTKTLYSDSTGSTKVEYNYTIDDDVTLYMKRSSSSGGGSGGSSSSGVTIKFDDSTISGTVGDTHQITATVTGSTSTPTWTSSDESVATVDSNGNITMVGVGTATITATVGTTTKTATVTVTEEDAATPEPTEEPEDTTPLISTDYAKAYANGYEDGSFRPDAYLTRAELASMIARLINGGDIADGAYYASFPDVDADAWYSKYIGYLEGFGILTGYEDGNFLPGDLVTRSEMCAVIARAQKFASVSYSGEYADVTYEDWARDYIATLAANGIVEGYDGNEFQPYGLLTRAEAVTIINRLLTSTDVEDEVSFNDISGHWAENAIILAASERLISSEMIDDEEEEVVEEEVVEDTTDEEATEEAADEESEESDEEAADESADEESADDESADDE